tara:strand:- start:2012 stop:3973 length:1962 start_codon:yes stop_codon:yes gene_type:complete
MSRRIFSLAKKLLPRISDTELIALQSGTVSIDRDIMSGRVDMTKLKTLTNEEGHYLNEGLIDICSKLQFEKVFDGTINSKVLDVLNKNGAFSYIIKQEYGGLELPVETQSRVLVKLASINPALAVTVMVPNSLGPGELLQQYGTDKQKQAFLPKLATGEYIPCFGLTGPHNGSDAGGKGLDVGRVMIVNGRHIIRVVLDKRYITLAPIANLMGIAIHVDDPDELLDVGSPGITVALLDKKKYPNLDNSKYHNPLSVGFPNGTLKGTIDIDVDDIIGGAKNIGHGWKMLMECLAAGRGVSLPASALGACLATSYGITGYSALRKQFKIPINKMQGVQEKLFKVVYNTLIIDSSVRLTNALLDSGSKPSVLSAIMKQQTTERGKEVIINAMDIHAGGAICQGENNFVSKFYSAGPIGITVEGSNTLTRSLIIFGQGLNKSHPHISDIVKALQGDNIAAFNTHFRKMGIFTVTQFIQSASAKIFSQKDSLRVNTIMFSNLTNIIALMGGKLKQEQVISGLMADLFSQLYMGYSISYTRDKYGLDDRAYDICLAELSNEAHHSLITLQRSLPIHLRLLTKLSCPTPKYTHITTSDLDYMSTVIWENSKLNSYIKEQIYTEDNVLGNINIAMNETDLIKHQKLVDNIISVGEYNNGFS